MNPFSFIAITAPASGSALDDMLRLIGIAAIVMAFFKGIKSLITKPAPAATASPANPRTTAGTQSAANDAIPPEIIAVIAAAVSSFTGRGYRVVSIRRPNTAWEKAGRQSVLSSHRIR